MARDPYLPPPDVCDWLLSQEWSDRIPLTEINYPEGGPNRCGKSLMLDFQLAHAAIGRDETARFFLPDDALQVLREDQRERRKALENARLKQIREDLLQARDSLIDALAGG